MDVLDHCEAQLWEDKCIIKNELKYHAHDSNTMDASLLTPKKELANEWYLAMAFLMVVIDNDMDHY